VQRPFLIRSGRLFDVVPSRFLLAGIEGILC